MKLLKARVTKYRSIDDSGWVDAGDVIALVGKNESGKTTFLQALEKLNSAERTRGNFDLTKDYPRRELSKYKKTHEDQAAKAVEAEFELTEAEISDIEEVFGEGVLKSNKVTASKDYANERVWSVEVDESKVLAHLSSDKELPSEASSVLKSSKTIKQAVDGLEKLTDKSPSTSELLVHIKKDFSSVSRRIINEFLVKFMPKFVYFGDYSVMKGTVNIQNLASKVANKPETVTEADRTFLALLANAGTDLDEYQNFANYESLKAELEGASASISDEVFEFWSQNKQLRVEFDIMQGAPSDPVPYNAGTNLHVRIWNDRHRVSVPFDERSRGFVWFFSFLAYFSQLDGAAGSLILLLDEPGLNLHGKAQADFLRFIDNRLASKYQVIYTTHSPFLIPSGNWDRIRTVQDFDDRGTVISKDVLKSDKDTLFPLQAALGYEVTQTLFVGPNMLLVEGPSDILYLQLFGRSVQGANHLGLDPRWTIAPCGGVDKAGTFVTLFGASNLRVAVLVDVNKAERQRINQLKEHPLLRAGGVIEVNEFLDGKQDADLEDLFEPELYLDLVNGAYANKMSKALQLADLPQGPRIVKRIEKHFEDHMIDGGHFNHFLPAEYFQLHQGEYMARLGKTVERAKAVFDRINTLLEDAAQSVAPSPRVTRKSVHADVNP